MKSITQGEYNYLVKQKQNATKRILSLKNKLQDEPDNMLYKNQLSQQIAKMHRIDYKLENYLKFE